MMSESPKKFDIFTSHIVANVSGAPSISTTVYMPHACSALSVHWTVALFYWKFSVFDDALCAFVWFGLCTFDA